MDVNARPPDKSHFRQEIVRAQDNGLAKLRQAQPTDKQYLLVSQRVGSLCLEHLRILDQFYLEFDEYVSREARSQHHQQWLQDRAAHLLQQLELAIDACVTTGIRQIGSQLTNPPREVVREVIVHPAPDWYKQIKADWWRLPGWLRLLLAMSVLTAVVVIVWAVIASSVGGNAGPAGPRTIQYGQEVSAQLSKTSQVNLWMFNGQAGDIVTVTMRPEGRGNAMGIGLQDPQGDNIAFEGRIVGIYRGDSLSIQAFPLPTTGTYTISTSIGYDLRTKYRLSLFKAR